MDLCKYKGLPQHGVLVREEKEKNPHSIHPTYMVLQLASILQVL